MPNECCACDVVSTCNWNNTCNRCICVCVCFVVTECKALQCMQCDASSPNWAMLGWSSFVNYLTYFMPFFRKKAHIATDTTSKERRRDTRRTNMCSAERGRNLWWMTLQYKRTSSIVARMQILSEYCIWFSVNTHQVATWQHGNRSIQWIL